MKKYDVFYEVKRVLPQVHRLEADNIQEAVTKFFGVVDHLSMSQDIEVVAVVSVECIA